MVRYFSISEKSVNRDAMIFVYLFLKFLLKYFKESQNPYQKYLSKFIIFMCLFPVR